MAENIYSGTIKPDGYQLLSVLTGISFQQNATYQIQLLNPAYMREGLVGKGFLVNTEKPFFYIADAPLYIAAVQSLYDTVELNISLVKVPADTDSDSDTDTDLDSDTDTDLDSDSDTDTDTEPAVEEEVE